MLSLTTYLCRADRGNTRPVGQSILTEGDNSVHVVYLHSLKVEQARKEGYVTLEEWQDEHPRFFAKNADERTWRRGWQNDWQQNAPRNVHKSAGGK